MSEDWVFRRAERFKAKLAVNRQREQWQANAAASADAMLLNGEGKLLATPFQRDGLRKTYRQVV